MMNTFICFSSLADSKLPCVSFKQCINEIDVDFQGLGPISDSSCGQITAENKLKENMWWLAHGILRFLFVLDSCSGVNFTHDLCSNPDKIPFKMNQYHPYENENDNSFGWPVKMSRFFRDKILIISTRHPGILESDWPIAAFSGQTLLYNDTILYNWLLFLVFYGSLFPPRNKKADYDCFSLWVDSLLF